MRAYPFLADFTVTSLYGYRSPIKTSEGYTSSFHTGIDLVGKGNINCVACESGTVVFTKYTQTLGNYLWIQTDSGYGLLYQHLKSFSVKAGDKVSCKQIVGVMGNTGKSTGPHLHFGVAKNTKWDTSYFGNDWIDPAAWLGMNGGSTIKGKTFNGSGYVTGNASDVTSTNNPSQSVTIESSTIVSGSGIEIVPSGEYYEVVDIKGTELDWLYGRKYRVFVDIGGGKAFDVSNLRCKFEISKIAYGQPQYSTLTIYNLNPDDENKIIKQGQRIVIEAGYQGSQYGMIFSGTIIQPLRSKENGVDYLLTLVSIDSDRFISYGFVGTTLVAEQSARDAVESVINKSSEEVGRGFLADTSITYPRGKVMFGMSKYYLEQIARSENSSYYTEDGKVNLISPASIDDKYILDFNPKSGLIGTPVQTEIGIQCKVLLNPQIKLNSLFHVDNQRITNYQYQQGTVVRGLDSEGIYRAIKVTHIGDTRDTDWYTEIEAITQAGTLPVSMADSSYYPW